MRFLIGEEKHREDTAFTEKRNRGLWVSSWRDLVAGFPAEGHFTLDIFDPIAYFWIVFYGVLAQLVEQRTENPCVPGSIPGDATIL